MPNFSLGAVGEQRAATFLQATGYTILDCNVRFGLHEVDLIATSPATNTTAAVLVFCEVKTRSSSFFGNPSQAVTPKKLHSMQYVARQYLKQHPWAGEYRFDVIAIAPTHIDHYENVTWLL